MADIGIIKTHILAVDAAIHAAKELTAALKSPHKDAPLAQFGMPNCKLSSN